MGQVYRATDSHLKRQVAIKVLPASVAGDADRLARFQREAEVLAALNHPHIAAIYGLEKGADFTALVMELVEGEDLSQRLARGAIPLDEALPIARQIAEALEAAHEQGIVHRDLKPANIKVRDDGTVKVLDFGLAKATAPTASSSGEAMQAATITTPAMTQAGMILGTAAYMAPEQAKGKAVDKRADIWAFGVVLYEMLTGARAFKGDDVTDIITAVMRDTPDWKALPLSTPASIKRLLRRCLEKDPRQRLRDLGDARLEFEATDDGEIVASARHQPRSRWSLAVLAGTALIVAATGFAGGLFSRRPAGAADREPSRSVITLGEGLSLSRLNRAVLALSPDDRALVFATNTAGRQYLSVKAIDEAEPREMPGTNGATGPFFSPDGRWLGFFADGQLKKMSLADGTLVALAAVADSTGAAWAPNGTIVFSPGYSVGLSRISAAGGAIETLTTRNAETHEASHTWPDVLPDGDHVLYTVEYVGRPFDEADIAVVSLATGATKVIFKGGSFARYSPSGHLLYVKGGRLQAAPFDPVRLEVTGDVTTVATGIASEIGRGRAMVAVSRAGSLAFAPGNATEADADLLWVTRDGSPTTASKEHKSFTLLSLSPDGQRALSQITGSDDDVWMLDLVRDIPTRLTFGTENTTPAFAPDGRQFAWSSDRNGPFNLYLSSIDNPQSVQRVTESDREQTAAIFSPDGKSLIYVQSGSATHGDVWMVPLGGKPQPLVNTSFEENAPAVSPDGRWLAYVSDETGRREVYVQPFPGPGPKRQVSDRSGRGNVPSPSFLPASAAAVPLPLRWSRDGRELFYWDDTTLMSVPITAGAPLSSGLPKRLFEMANVMDMEPSPDGRRFLVARRVAPERLNRIVVALGGALQIGRASR